MAETFTKKVILNTKFGTKFLRVGCRGVLSSPANIFFGMDDLFCRPLDCLSKLNSLKSSFRNFNRFSMSPEDKSPLEVAPSVGFSDTVTMSELSRGFDNPMYSEPGAMVVRYFYIL